MLSVKKTVVESEKANAWDGEEERERENVCVRVCVCDRLSSFPSFAFFAHVFSRKPLPPLPLSLSFWLSTCSLHLFLSLFNRPLKKHKEPFFYTHSIWFHFVTFLVASLFSFVFVFHTHTHALAPLPLFLSTYLPSSASGSLSPL